MSCHCCNHAAHHSHRHDEGHDEPGVSCHSHDADQDEDPKARLRKIVVAAALLLAASVLQRLVELPLWLQLLAFLPSYAVAGASTLREAAENIGRGDPFDEDFLMSVATIGALVIGFIPGGEPMFAEAVFVMLFFEVGELFEEMAEDNSRKSVAKLMDIRPDTASVERAGAVEVVDPGSVGPGETIVIRPGERVPLDGVVLEGASSLDTVALTGESLPRDVTVGSEVVSGCVNVSGVLRVRVTRSFGESTASKILRLIEDAGQNKSRSEGFIRRFARAYTPVVVCLAIVVALLPPSQAATLVPTSPPGCCAP